MMFTDQVENLYHELTPLYRNIHAYVRRKLYETYGPEYVSLTGPIPAHILGESFAFNKSATVKFITLFTNLTISSCSGAYISGRWEHWRGGLDYAYSGVTLWDMVPGERRPSMHTEKGESESISLLTINRAYTVGNVKLTAPFGAKHAKETIAYMVLLQTACFVYTHCTDFEVLPTVRLYCLQFLLILLCCHG